MYCYRLTGEETRCHRSFVLLRVRELMKSKNRKSILTACLPASILPSPLNWAQSVKGNLSLARNRDNRVNQTEKDT